MIGHEERILKQYQFTNKSWLVEDKSRPILPKDEGSGIMISSFQSREFLFRYPLSAEQLRNVNDKRRGESYCDEEAAKIRRGQQENKDLASSPFYVEFEYGEAQKGYWNYEHFVFQCEDVVECIQVLQPAVSFYLCVDN